MIFKTLFGAAMLGLAGSVCAAPVLISPDWGAETCQAWNASPVLTQKLVESGWVKNHEGRGFKVIQFYREDCGDKPTAELRIALQGNLARCVYGGKAETQALASGADYVMSAETDSWIEMGRGDYGPMRAMISGSLGFDGPMGEAMSNMKPFESFLLLVGKVPADTRQCPDQPGKLSASAP